MNRDEMIEWLIREETDFVRSEVEGGGLEEYLELHASLMRHGFNGYANWTDESLRKDILDRDPDNMRGHNLRGPRND